MKEAKKRMKMKLLKKNKTPKVERITKKNIDEHRDAVLKSGRKFKYPFQYSRHKVLINTVLIALIAVVAFAGVSWFMLYREQTRDNFFYTLSRIVPVPVATVDGKAVPYSEYLLRLRSSLTYLKTGGSEVDLNSESGANYIEHIKRQELTESEKTIYARSLAHEHNLSVSDDEVNKFINQSIKTTDASLSLDAFTKTVLNDLYGESLDDYKNLVRDSLLRIKVKQSIDTGARNRINNLADELNGDPTKFATVAKENSDDAATKANGGLTEVTLSDNLSDPNGLVAAAEKLKKNEISDVITGTDGYYLVQMNEKTDTTLKYSVIKIAFTEFDKRFDALKNAGKIHEFIKVAEKE
jgi:hypothetical protein